LTSSREISIVVPVYNSEKGIPELSARINESLAGRATFEIIFINDGSRDNSWKVIKDLADRYPNITGLNLRKNSGQDNAILAGLRTAKGNYVIIMDDDLQHDPSDILNLYQACKSGFDVCYANFRTKKQSVLKNSGSTLNGRMAELLVQKPKEIYLSPYKIVRRSLVNEIIHYSGPYPYIDGIILSLTSNITQVQTQHHQRFEGKSNYTLTKSVSVFMKLFTGFSVVPLRIATMAGCLATFIGLCLLVKYIYNYFFIPEEFVAGWTTVVVLIILFSGLILITLGIVGEYIGRMYLTINHKPQYSISEIIRSNETPE
jgi:undecaprenyl-phosphate 4-deoxy-4-formamido-L-arabinose transferase